jgi:glutamate synthase (NADPH/NADH) small chain
VGETTGFLQWQRTTAWHRPVPVRLRDWKEVYEEFPKDVLHQQAGRCMVRHRSATTAARSAT